MLLLVQYLEWPVGSVPQWDDCREGLNSDQNAGSDHNERIIRPVAQWRPVLPYWQVPSWMRADRGLDAGLIACIG